MNSPDKGLSDVLVSVGAIVTTMTKFWFYGAGRCGWVRFLWGGKEYDVTIRLTHNADLGEAACKRKKK